MTLWMVRCGKHGERESLALENGLALVGWGRLQDLSKIKTRDEMKQLIEEKYPERVPRAISSFAGQLMIIRKKIKKGDIVAMPLKSRSAVALGIVEKPYSFMPENPPDSLHAIKVKWIREDTPRTDFGQDLLYSLGATKTVCQIKRNNAEERVKAMLTGDPDPKLKKPVNDSGDVEPTDEPQLVDIEEHAMDQIRSRIGDRFMGHDLSRLVESILKARGYQTYFSTPGPDGGVDIIAGGGSMGFDSPKLCVQVKSGATPVDVTSLRELQGVMKNFGAEHGLFVSWSGFKESVYKEARKLFFEIRLWDSDKLLKALLDSYEQLPDEIQADLPLKRIWTIVQEE